MKKKNIIYFLLIIMLTFAGISCQPDFIEQTDVDNLTTGSYFRNEDDAFFAVMETYSRITYWGWRFGEYTLAPMVYRGDDVELLAGAASWPYLSDIGTFNYTNVSEVPQLYWERAYYCLNSANFVIDGVSAMGEDVIDINTKNTIIGEALFIRGIIHMQLVSAYKRVIMVDSYTTSVDELDRPITPADQIWDLIESDLTTAAGYLPQSWDDSNLGRATKGAAYGYLGKAHLYQEEWIEAHAAFDLMPDVYDLVTNFEDLFTGDENSEESVFEIQFSTDESGGLGWKASLAVTIATSDIGGWDMLRPSDKLIADFQVEAASGGGYDERLTGSIIWNDPASTFLGNPLAITTPSFKKYIAKAIDDWQSGENFYFMRYADVLLMDAEALNESGSTAAAILLLDRVRNRAGLVNFAGSGQAAVRTEIRKQRFLELACEGHRFFDLVRWGIATDVLHNSGVNGATNYVEANHGYFYVPQIEVDNNTQID